MVRFTTMIGAGVIIFSTTTKKVLLVRRSDSGCWANLGGSMEDFETPYQCSIREVMEESQLRHGIDYKIIGTKPVHTKVVGNLTYHTYFAICDGEPNLILNDENVSFDWFLMDSLPQPLHFGVSESLHCDSVKRKIKKYLG